MAFTTEGTWFSYTVFLNALTATLQSYKTTLPHCVASIPLTCINSILLNLLIYTWVN